MPCLIVDSNLVNLYICEITYTNNNTGYQLHVITYRFVLSISKVRHSKIHKFVSTLCCFGSVLAVFGCYYIVESVNYFYCVTYLFHDDIISICTIIIEMVHLILEAHLKRKQEDYLRYHLITKQRDSFQQSIKHTDQ